jgi:outer membrane protein assembly factor BamA
LFGTLRVSISLFAPYSLTLNALTAPKLHVPISQPMSHKVLSGIILTLCLCASAALAQPRVRNIHVQVDDVFDGSAGSIYRTANALKVNTKEHVVRQEILLKEGDTYDQFKVDESARFLRTLPFFRKVTIIPTFDGDFVDLLVLVEDQWTLIPQMSFSLGGGANDSQTIGLIERNLLGFGKRTELVVGEDEGREKIEAVYDDLRVFGTDQRLFLSFFERSDGWSTDGLWGKPFRTLADDFSWGGAWDLSNTIGRLFALGDERYIFRQEHTEFSGRYVKAFGDPASSLNRVSFGYGYARDVFTQANDDDFRDISVDPDVVSNDLAFLPTDRIFSGPFVGIDHIEADYISTNYIDRFDIIQDFNLGTEYSVSIQGAPEVMGSTRNTFLMSGSARSGIRFGDKEFGRGEIGGSFRTNSDGVENLFLRAEEKYFNVLGPKYLLGRYVGQHTIAAAISFEYGHRFDGDRQLLLGAENGLRGYESRTFEGDKRFLFTVEDRVTLVEDLFDLVSLGGVIFADAGGTTYDAPGRIFKNEFYSNVGLGLRIGFPRSSGGGVVRIDLAVPLREDPQSGEQKYEPRLTISTGQIFGGRMSTEQYGLEKANVSVGLAR